MTRRSAGAALAASVGVLCVSLPGAAEASFPGRNGVITVATGDRDGGCGMGPCGTVFQMVNVDPRTGSRRRVPTCVTAPCLDGDPAWSPDGARLLFDRTPNRLRVLPRTGMPSRDVGSGSGGAWSPDGRQLVFNDTGSRFGSTRGGELIVAPVAGGRRRQLTLGGGFGPDWSVRGSIAFTRLDPDFRELSVLTVPERGGRPREVARNAQDPSWSPDGRHLAFTVANRAPGAIAIVSRGKRRLLTRRGRLPQWSPDGKFIAFMRGTTLFTARSDGSHVRRVATLLVNRVFSVSWRPKKR